MDLNDLRTFVAVAEHASFSRAAAELGVAKSTVSERVRSLERDLDAALLQRSTRRVSLTDAGEALLDKGRAIAALAADAEAELTTATRSAVGRLRMSAPTSFGIRFLTGVVAELAGSHPRLSVDFQLEDRAVDLVAERFDLAIRIGRLPSSSLVVQKIGVSRRLVVASPDYLARNGLPTEPADLRSHECILYTHQSRLDTWVFDGPDGNEERTRVGGHVQSNHGDAIAELAARGAGIAWLPEFIVQPLIDAGRLVGLLSERCVAEMPIHVVFPTRSHRTFKESLVVEALRRRLAA
ncbi:MAG: LysR family transcriptional regulator [Myxococcales bacterium]|nr:LysR family transcriptional regulator [Myxococcales bacterium]